MLERWVAEYGAVERDHPALAQHLAEAICDLQILIGRVRRESLPDAPNRNQADRNSGVRRKKP